MTRRERIYRAIYGFGDSYIDNGNLHEVSGHAYQPDPPYWNGRWTDGPNFVDVLAENLGMESVKPSAMGGTNYGYGGATVAVDWDFKGVLIKSTKTQVEQMAPCSPSVRTEPAGVPPQKKQVLSSSCAPASAEVALFFSSGVSGMFLD